MFSDDPPGPDQTVDGGHTRLTRVQRLYIFPVELVQTPCRKLTRLPTRLYRVIQHVPWRWSQRLVDLFQTPK
jgi:hypothetical protein